MKTRRLTDGREIPVRDNGGVRMTCDCGRTK